jgi:uncharacterized integral membrane protein
MMNDARILSEDELLRRAKRRVGVRMGFYIHATVFVLVNLGLAGLNYANGGVRWHLWPLGWWGLGLAIHGLVTLFSLRGDGLRERLLQREVERLRAQQPPGAGR